MASFDTFLYLITLYCSDIFQALHKYLHMAKWVRDRVGHPAISAEGDKQRDNTAAPLLALLVWLL